MKRQFMRSMAVMVTVMMLSVAMVMPVSADSGIKVNISSENGARSANFSDSLGYPFIDANSRTLVPLRAVADAMGIAVAWDDATKTAIFTDDETGTDPEDGTVNRMVTNVYFTIGSSEYRYDSAWYIDGELFLSDKETKSMDTTAVNVGGRTYAPIRYLAELLGYEVSWDDNTKTVGLAGKDNQIQDFLNT